MAAIADEEDEDDEGEIVVGGPPDAAKAEVQPGTSRSPEEVGQQRPTEESMRPLVSCNDPGEVSREKRKLDMDLEEIELDEQALQIDERRLQINKRRLQVRGQMESLK